MPAENSPSDEGQIHACRQTVVVRGPTQINSYVYRGIQWVISRTSADRDRAVIKSSPGVGSTSRQSSPLGSYDTVFKSQILGRHEERRALTMKGFFNSKMAHPVFQVRWRLPRSQNCWRYHLFFVNLPYTFEHDPAVFGAIRYGGDRVYTRDILCGSMGRHEPWQIVSRVNNTRDHRIGVFNRPS